MKDRAFITAAAVLLAAIAAMWAAVFSMGLHLVKPALPLRQPLYLLGDRLGAYHKVADEPMSHEVVAESGTDKFILARYQESYGTSAGALALRLYVGYHSGEPDARPQVSNRSYPLGAVRPVDPMIEHVTLQSPGLIVNPDSTASAVDPHGRTVMLPTADVPVALYRFTTREGKEVTLVYFFVANGRFFTDAAAVQDAIFDLRNPAAYWAKIELHFTGAGREQALVATQRFLSDALPAIMASFPDAPTHKPDPAPHAGGGDFNHPVPGPNAIPLPSSALMGLTLLGGVIVFARFPASAKRRRRLRRA